MEIGLTWMPVLLAALVLVAAVAVALVLWRRGRRRARAALPVAHSERLTALPGYRRLVRRHRVLLAGVAVVTGAALLAAGLLASRPVTSTVERSDRFTRDVVLCLDVSGSLSSYDVQILDQFQGILDRLHGERIGLVVWDSSAVQVFPLTDDYPFMSGELQRVRDSLEDDPFDPDADDYALEGTLVAAGASLIGDGLASCVLRFDRLGDERSRSIVLATDNMVNGEPLVSLTEAGEFAAARGVRVYGLNPAETYAPVEAQEFRSVVEGTDGAYFRLDDPGATGGIVQRVLAEDATHLRGVPELIYTDEPHLPLAVLAVLAALVLVLAWRVRL